MYEKAKTAAPTAALVSTLLFPPKLYGKHSPEELVQRRDALDLFFRTLCSRAALRRGMPQFLAVHGFRLPTKLVQDAEVTVREGFVVVKLSRAEVSELIKVLRVKSRRFCYLTAAGPQGLRRNDVVMGAGPYWSGACRNNSEDPFIQGTLFVAGASVRTMRDFFGFAVHAVA